MAKVNRVVQILMERDGLTQKEAEQLVEQVRDECEGASPEEVEDIFMCDLGLEMDYIFDVLC